MDWNSVGETTCSLRPLPGLRKWAIGERAMYPCSSAQLMARMIERQWFRFVPLARLG